MNYRWLTAISIVGILLGIADFILNFVFNLYGCFCPAGEVLCVCEAPFSYYLYTYYVPVAIIGVSVVTIVWSLRLQRRLNFSRVESEGRSHE